MLVLEKGSPGGMLWRDHKEGDVTSQKAGCQHTFRGPPHQP